MAITSQRLTFEEFLQLPEEEPALEYVDGVVTQKMSPKGPHGGLQAELAYLVKAFLRISPIAQVYTELRTNWTGEASLVPDLAVYRLERIPTKPTGEVADDFFDPPDIAVEIASPGQSDREIMERARWFIEHGVHVVLLLQPRNRSARIVRRDSDSGLLQRNAVVDLSDVLPGFSFVVRDLFATLDVPPRPSE